MLIPTVGCIEKNESNTIECAPCTLNEIWRYNDLLCQKFFPIRLSAGAAVSSPLVTVNGEEWTRAQFMLEELEEGDYTIKFYTNDKHVVSSYKDGQRVNEPFIRSQTLYVKISNSAPDIYDFEYRQANGLWIDIMTQDWYQRLYKEWGNN